MWYGRQRMWYGIQRTCYKIQETQCVKHVKCVKRVKHVKRWLVGWWNATQPLIPLLFSSIMSPRRYDVRTTYGRKYVHTVTVPYKTNKKEEEKNNFDMKKIWSTGVYPIPLYYTVSCNYGTPCRHFMEQRINHCALPSQELWLFCRLSPHPVLSPLSLHSW